MLLGACPRCHGDLVAREGEYHAWIWHCIQCARNYGELEPIKYKPVREQSHGFLPTGTE